MSLKLHTPIFCLLLFSLFSCKKEEADMRLSSMDVPIITGFYYMGYIGESNSIVGYPNHIKISLKENNDFDFSFSASPNPCNEILFLYFTEEVENKKKEIWMTPGIYEGPNDIANFENLALNLYAGGAPIFQTTTNRKYVSLNVSSFMDGYYVIYVKIEDTIKSWNVIINKNYKS